MARMKSCTLLLIGENSIKQINYQKSLFFFERVSTSQGKGTKLILTNLHRPATWEGDELATLKGQLSQLISPFIENRPFLVYMTVNGESINIVQEFTDLINVSLATYSFSFDGKFLEISGSIKAPKLIGNNTESKDNYRVYIEADNGKKFARYFLDKKKKTLRALYRQPTMGFLHLRKEYPFYLTFPD